MTTVAIIATLAIAGWIHDAEQGGYANALMKGGLAVTFALVWLRHARDWVKVVIVALAVLAIISVFLASYAEFFWPVAIILVGAYLLYNSMHPKMVRRFLRLMKTGSSLQRLKSLFSLTFILMGMVSQLSDYLSPCPTAHVQSQASIPASYPQSNLSGGVQIWYTGISFAPPAICRVNIVRLCWLLVECNSMYVDRTDFLLKTGIFITYWKKH